MIFVAEIGLNHNGNFNIIFEMIKEAKNSGADIAKFQFGWRDKPGEINCIDDHLAKDIKSWCDYHEIEMMASPITPDGLKKVKMLNLKKCKIASRTVLDYPDMCKDIINDKSFEKVYCSLGFWDRENLPFESKSDHLKYLYCISKYPTYPSDLKNFPKHFNDEKYYGYSDHTHGISACLFAISRGAKLIEKHFTLDKTSQVIRDHAISATPYEFSKLVSTGREISKIFSIT
jgi:N,N'-diacetyllegionaminate synthase